MAYVVQLGGAGNLDQAVIVVVYVCGIVCTVGIIVSICRQSGARATRYNSIGVSVVIVCIHAGAVILRKSIARIDYAVVIIVRVLAVFATVTVGSAVPALASAVVAIPVAPVGQLSSPSATVSLSIS